MTSPADKADLRARMRALRRALAKAHPGAARAAAALLPPALVLRASVVGSYNPQGAELDPGPVAAALAGREGRIVLPTAQRRDAALIFRAPSPGARLVADAYGVPAPPPGAAEAVPDLLLVPLLAFDRSGGRLGQGAGAYDRTIENLRASGRVFVLGLAYAGQEIDQVPAEVHDQRLDGVMTETGYTEFR